MIDLEQELREGLHRDVDTFRRGWQPSKLPPHVRRRVRHRQSRNVAALLGVLTLVVAGLTWTLPRIPGFTLRATLAGSNLVDTTRSAGVHPIYLEDGTPVFLIVGSTGGVMAVQATSPHAPFGVSKLLWWCPSSHTFADPFHGSSFDESGRYLSGPAPTGLVPYIFEPVGGGGLRVGPAQAPLPRGLEAEQPRDPFCTEAAKAVFHTPSGIDVADLQLDARGDGWSAVRGQIWRGGGLSRLCDGSASGPCVDLPRVEPSTRRDGGWNDRRTWLVRIVDGVIEEVAAVIPANFVTE